MTALTVDAEDSESELFDVPVSDMQDNIVISADSVSGTLKYLDGENPIVSEWGAGYFLCVNLSENTFTGLESVKVGMTPSEGSGLVEIIDDPDKNGVFKVTDKDNQRFTVLQTATSGKTRKQYFSLKDLVLEAEG